MTIVVEDGSIVDDANSYSTEAELTTYATARGVTLSGDTEQLLIQAMDYLEVQSFIGSKYTQDQSLQWPRTGAVIDGFSISYDSIPNELKTAQMAIAVSIDEGNSPNQVITPSIKSKKIDVLETVYQDGAVNYNIDPKVQSSLKKLIKANNKYVSFMGRG